jgi:hypothetical protein
MGSSRVRRLKKYFVIPRVTRDLLFLAPSILFRVHEKADPHCVRDDKSAALSSSFFAFLGGQNPLPELSRTEFATAFTAPEISMIRA